MATSMSLHTTTLADTLAERPAMVVAAVCAPAHQSDLTGVEVVEVAELLGIDFAAAPFTVAELQAGIEVELELGQECAPSMVDVMDDDLLEIGKIAVTHLQQRSDYYSQLTQAHAPGDPQTCHRPADVGCD
jgi:Protein of unknown function (DUF5661)